MTKRSAWRFARLACMEELARVARIGRSAVLASGILAAATTTLPQTAAAADFFTALFGGGSSGSFNNRRVVKFSKKFAPGQVIVSFSDRRLYYIADRGKALSYPISVPRPQSRWQGTLRVTRKKVNPSWTPTPEMLQENPRLPRFVPGGHPRNPLGNRALYLGSTLYRIHGTDAPSTIGKAVSKGCVRMHNAHVADLYNRVPVGTKVTVTWHRFRRG